MAWATAMTASGYGMQAGSSIMQGSAARDEAKFAAKMNEYNAQVSERDAKAVELKTKFDQIRQQQRASKIMGSLRAKLGASGALMDEGAPLNLQAEQAWESELENALIGYEGQVQASRLRSEAALSRVQGKFNKLKGKNAMTAGYLGAGSSLLSGFGNMYAQGMFGKPEPGGSE